MFEGRIPGASDFRLPIHDPANRPARERHLSTFLCPSDSKSHDGYIEMAPGERYAMGCYVASFGPPDLDAAQENRDGVFSRNSATRLADIRDGLSSTFFAGERENGPFRNAASHGVHFEYETTWAGAVREITDPSDDYGHMILFQTGHTPNSPQSDDRDISTPHAGIAQFLMGDGSVHSIGETIDFGVYTALGTRDGGEVIGSFP
jgi:hypothetical protein